MFISGDTLLLNLIKITLPGLCILIGTLIYSYKVINRYSKALKRLYSSSFRGVDTERKRIASELHDTLAVSSILLSEDFIDLKSKLKGDEAKPQKKPSP